MSISLLKWGIEQQYSRGIGFITEWTVAGDATARTITLPLTNNGTFNCRVNWGDGSPKSVITAYDDADRVHTYAADGTYQVTITGECPAWSFNNGGDKTKITDIIYWGDSSAFGGFEYITGGFYGCTALKSTGPAGSKIIAKAALVSCQGIFRNCTNASFTAITAGIFDNCTELTASAFEAAFIASSNLATIPTDLFKYCTKVSSRAFYQCFSSTKIASIPADLFKYNVLANTNAFYGTFATCTSLTTVPTDLFRYNTLVTSFEGTFSNCTNASLSIPANIFDYNTAVTTFKGLFGTTRFSSIVADIFKYNVSNLSFESAFLGNTNITTLPSDIFRYNTLVTTFFDLARSNSKMTTVPASLFKYNTAVTSFLNAFKDCVKLQLRTDMFFDVSDDSGIKTATLNAGGSGYAANDLCTVVQAGGSNGIAKVLTVDGSGVVQTFEILYLSQGTGYSVANDLETTGGTGTGFKINITAIGTLRFTNKTVNFTSAMHLTAAFTGTQGTAPNLWDADYGTGTATKLNCWTGQDSGVDNWASIPNEWKGL